MSSKCVLRHFGRRAIVGITAVLAGCAVTPEEFIEGSQASASAAPTESLNVSLDAPTSWLVDHSEFVTFALSYSDHTIEARTLFSRADLAAGTKTKTYGVRSDVTIERCSFSWSITESAFGTTASRKLLTPTDFDGVHEGACTMIGGSAVLRLPWAMTTLNIELPPTALEAHSARGVVVNVSVEGIRQTFAPPGGYVTQPASWSVDVLAPEGATRKASLTWVPLPGGATTRTIVETTTDNLRLE